MTSTMTETIFNGLVAERAALECNSGHDEDKYREAHARWTEKIGDYVGTGEPADDDKAHDIGPDYICALDDGRIVCWGSDYVVMPGVAGREIMLVP